MNEKYPVPLEPGNFQPNIYAMYELLGSYDWPQAGPYEFVHQLVATVLGPHVHEMMQLVHFDSEHGFPSTSKLDQGIRANAERMGGLLERTKENVVATYGPNHEVFEAAYLKEYEVLGQITVPANNPVRPAFDTTGRYPIPYMSDIYRHLREADQIVLDLACPPEMEVARDQQLANHQALWNACVRLLVYAYLGGFDHGHLESAIWTTSSYQE